MNRACAAALSVSERGVRRAERLGRHLVEFARLPRLRADSLNRVCTHEGWQNLLDARTRGKGVLLLAAHFGAWELIPYAQALRGEPMAFVVRPADNEPVENLIRSFREVHGNQVIPKQSAVRACLRGLRAGKTVGILIDQRVPADWGVETKFLGQSVYTTPIVAALALRTGAPVVPAFAVRQPNGSHRIVVGPEVEVVRTGDYRNDVRVNTQRFVEVVEGFVREHPEQWLWIHRRFRASHGRVEDPAPAVID